MESFDKKNKIGKALISELQDFRFFVPDYQRGYRWTEDEVTALLDDCWEAKEKKCDGYCLQPLIVLPKTDEKGEYYEVVDGQQRLTTLFIFMQIARRMMDGEPMLFTLSYHTRDSFLYLEKFSDKQETEKILQNEALQDDIDFYHITEAYKTMIEWFNDPRHPMRSAVTLYDYICSHVFFIWYRLPEDARPIEVFTKVNLGKIPLTNAELIKALFLNRDNFQSDRNSRDNEVCEESVQMAMQWDTIEQGLNEEAFWYFIQNENGSGTHIDLLFNLLAEEENENLGRRIKADRNYFSFMVFYEILRNAENKKEKVEELWKKIQSMYSDFRHWYSNSDYYHLIGYLVCAGVSLREMRKLTRGKKKSEMQLALIERCMTTFNKLKDRDAANSDGSPADNLTWLYNVVYADGKLVNNILLLFNIATIYCENKQEFRFPFNLFKQDKWDIEHIHATANEQDDPDMRLCNLTLLNKKINQSISDSDLDKKRDRVLEYESKGWFIPLCTRNVYLKAYTPITEKTDPNTDKDWTATDKKYYIEKMESIFKKFSHNERELREDIAKSVVAEGGVQ